MHRFAVRRLERRDPGVRAPVLPAEDGRQGAPALAVPAHGARALAREARPRHFRLARPERGQRRRGGLEDGRDRLLAVLLGPARLRPREPDVARAAREDAPGRVHDQGAARVRSLIYRKDETHAEAMMLALWRASE